MKKSELRQIIREIIISELDFKSQDAFNAYNKQHKLRQSTKVNIAGKQTTAGQAGQAATSDKNKDVQKQTASPAKSIPKIKIPDDVDKDNPYEMADFVASNFGNIIDKTKLKKGWQENGLDATNIKRIEKFLKIHGYLEGSINPKDALNDFWDEWGTIDSQWVGGGSGTVSGGQYFSGDSGKSVSTNDRLDKYKGK